MNVELPLTLGVRGRFRLTAIRPDGTRRELADWFDNLILDQGLDRIGSGAWITRCEVGTGSSSPAVTQTQLDSRVASTTTVQSSNTSVLSSSPYTASYTVTFRFAEGAAEGNLSEVGVGWALDTLFSRALIEDADGNATTITVLADEVLDVTYEFQVNPPLSDSTFSRTISGTSYDITLRAANAGGNAWNPSPDAGAVTLEGINFVLYDGDIGAITTDPAGNSSNSDTLQNMSDAAYSGGSYRLEGSVNAGLDDANFPTGIKSIRYGSNNLAALFQASFTPVLDKDDTKTLSLTVAAAWARA